MFSATFFQYAVLVTLGSVAALLAVAFAVLTRVYARHVMRMWTVAWAFESIHVLGGLLALLLQRQADGAPVAATMATLLSQFTGFGSGFLLLLGALWVVRGRAEQDRQRQLGLLVCGLCALVTTFAVPLDGGDASMGLHLLARVGILQAVAGVLTAGAGVLLWRAAAAAPTPRIGMRWTATIAVGLGLHRLQYLLLALATVAGGGASSVVAYTSLLPLVELVFVAALGIGAGIAMVEEERESVQDATARQLAAERAARASGASMVSALAAIPDLVAVVGARGEVLAWNPAFEAYVRTRGRGALGIGAPLLAVMPRSEHEDAWRTRLPLVLAGRNDEFECGVAADAAGPAIAFDVTARPIRDAGMVVGAVFVARDITERRSLEQHLQQSQRLDTVGRLAGGIAHDFNNLLTAIMNSAAMAREALPPEHEATAELHDIQLATERAASLTRQLLAFSRRQPVSQEPVDLGERMATLERMLSRLAGPGVRFTLAVEEGLWPVRADLAQVEQVIVNLVVNARDAMPTGGSIEVALANRRVVNGAMLRRQVPDGEYVEVLVRDSGSGIDEETMRHVFEPFFTTKPVGQGTGLGLAMCYGIVRQHRGHIWIESTVGRGATVLFLLPRHLGVVAPRTAFVGPAGPGAHLTGAEGILLVEDEPQVRTVAARVLRGAGYRVFEATNGRDGLQLARRERGMIDLIVTDVVMPEMGGREMVELTRVFAPEAAVLFVSGYAAGGLPTMAEGAGTGARFLQKPFSPTELLTAVRTILDTRRTAGTTPRSA